MPILMETLRSNRIKSLWSKNMKVDMVVSLINAMRLWHEEDIDGSVYETDEREMGFLVI